MVDRISDAGERKEDLVECPNRHRVCQQGGWSAQPDTTNIATAIDLLIARSRAGGGLEIEFYGDFAIGELRPELQTAVFSIVQELLLNACRHSKSKKVLVGLGEDDERVFVQVQDWGIGFDHEMVRPHKRGLKGIREVARWLGGTVDIDSRPGAGTCIVVEIPLLQETEPSGPTCEHRPR